MLAKVASAIVKASQHSQRMGTNIVYSSTREITINTRRKPSLPGSSAACSQGKHWNCYKSNCTCDCGHGVM